MSMRVYTESMKNNLAVFVVLAVLLGFGAGYAVAGREPAVGQHVMPSGSQMDDADMSMGNAMDDMNMALDGKSGDAFDQEFLEQMIVHHEGAVEMAQAALERAKHNELKQMARDIIAAQSAEIAQMKQWMTGWYGTAN